MSVNNFIPEIWSAAVFDIFQKNLVYGGLANTDYQGEIRQYGDTVRINEIGDITINAYTKNSTTAITIQELADSQQVLTIDRARYWGFKLDDLDQAQTNPKLMSKAMERAAYNLKDETDSYLATLMSTGNFFQGTNSTELGSTVTALSAASTAVVVAFSWYDRIMNQNNVPTNGRWIVVPPAIAQQLVNARIIAETANSQVMNEGTKSIGNFYGFDVFVSNNCYGVPSSQWHVIAGHSAGLTFAGQLTKVEAYRDQNSFSDVVRGLYVYGAKITRPNAIIKGVLTSS